MNRYLPSEKLSDEYLASERDRLRKFVFSLFENPFEEEITALEKIEDRYEQLKECVRLQDKMQEYVASEEYTKEIALQFLTIAEFDEAAFNRYFEEHSEYTVITLYELAKEFFESIEKGDPYRFKEISYKSRSEILEIGEKFFANYPEWVQYVVRIEASKLSLRDKFMQHKPKTDEERMFKKQLKLVIQNGIKDFYRLKIDPSLDSKGHICFMARCLPAIDRSYNWWYKNAKEFNPKLKSRLGTKSEYIAFLGVLIKTLIAEEWSVSEAWDAVCNDSKKLGHYRNSKNAKRALEPTGSRAIAGFCDLANTYKILAGDEEVGEFWIAGGSYNYYSYYYVLAFLGHYDFCYDSLCFGVGWLVLF